jgi:release factor glutamine methyltransferase
MNDSSSISFWLTQATSHLAATGIPSARLDAELILSHTLRKGRTWLRAHDDELLDARTQEIADARLALRLDRVPVAYIIGHKEFYGRRFTVTTSTLIPRPESEAIIELLGELEIKDSMRLVDVGTGSGCLGITAKLEHPALDVTLIDTSAHALAVAKKNAAALNADVTFLKSDLLSGYPFTADIILANLPYVDPEWQRSPETDHEPSLALFAKDNGLALIKKLIDQSHTKLSKGGYILIEADRRQHHLITNYAQQHNLTLTATRGLIVTYQAV